MIEREVIVIKCIGCERSEVVDGQTVCKVYPWPSKKWIVNACPMATHLKKEAGASKKMLNPIKKSKRRS